MRVPIAIALAASVLASPFLARPAQAYVRTLSDSGAPLYWPSSCAAVTIYLNGFSLIAADAMMTSDEVAKSIAAAAHAWSADQVTCPGPDGDAGSGHPYFEIVPALATGGSVPGIANDGKNSIVFPTVWTDDPEAIAFTSHFSRPDGEIVDTDMEINPSPATGEWANLDLGASGHVSDPIDLQTAITHEFGHFIGLAHTCVTDGEPSARDDQGQPVPSCDDPSVPQAQAVMWFEVTHGSTTKRVLALDDVRAVCDIYPAAKDPHTCALNLPDDGCGCATGGARDARGTVLSLLALGLTVIHCRRRLRSDRDRRAAL
jgi:MYXO-CTERM domain-containing protein